MEKLFIYADKEIFEVISFNGAYLNVLDKSVWGHVIPISRVERFCDENGNHINFKIKNGL